MSYPIFDLHKAFAAFMQHLNTLSIEERNKIVTKVMGGTGYNNLVLFHKSLNVPTPVKLEIYNSYLAPAAASELATNLQLTEQLSNEEFSNAIFSDSKKKELENEISELRELVESQKQHCKIARMEVEQAKIEAKKEADAWLAEEREAFKKKKVEEIVITRDNISTTLKVEVIHKQFPSILKILSATNALGKHEFLWLVSKPGAGKSEMANQLGAALGVTTYIHAGKADLTTGQVFGFQNLLLGNYVEGFLYKPWKEGGLLVLDEADKCEGIILASLNRMDNNTITFPNGETVEKHPDFYFMCLANTRGTGATKGFKSNKLDAATLDRFIVIELSYDNEFEKTLFKNESWVEYVQRVRDYCERTFTESIYITPRASRQGEMLLRIGTSVEETCDMTLFKFTTPDQKNTILQNVGMFNGSTISTEEPKFDIGKPKNETVYAIDPVKFFASINNHVTP